jgi:hypothetical protein
LHLLPEDQNLCTVVIPRGKHSYLRLSKGIAIAHVIFLSKISQLMVGFDFVKTYLDDVLVATKGSYSEYSQNLEQVLVKQYKANLRINDEKCTFATQEFEYLDYLVKKLEFAHFFLRLKQYYSLRRLRP